MDVVVPIINLATSRTINLGISRILRARMGMETIMDMDTRQFQMDVHMDAQMDTIIHRTLHINIHISKILLLQIQEMHIHMYNTHISFMYTINMI